ncbi:hypothetical protein CEUSTIGMA_g790.t1 [Chlamydomonas eustigma]|uniref:EF-hand domain-containing protein n=1 Tax=Chlamydomonas eustigma TaxID=1157962 RepID=A0A250WRK8_9CHLO|nr:hypothetical protein CEUSTIGMA_g790.t1 [Chlamydomonas eustigma]|eukprot:GAX73336.1 hypothetical protein CEUSTIGMA_g790.t1 [Chlamydomonas eustigma]
MAKDGCRGPTMGKSLSIATSKLDVAVWQATTTGHHRRRSTRVIVGILSDEERSELDDLWALLVGRGTGDVLTHVHLEKAADVVLGKDNYKASDVKRALSLMDLNRNGVITHNEFLSFMIANQSASKDADTTMAAATTLGLRVAQGDVVIEDMITVGGMRLPDLILAYRRRTALEQQMIKMKEALKAKATDENMGGRKHAEEKASEDALVACKRPEEKGRAGAVGMGGKIKSMLKSLFGNAALPAGDSTFSSSSSSSVASVVKLPRLEPKYGRRSVKEAAEWGPASGMSNLNTAPLLMNNSSGQVSSPTGPSSYSQGSTLPLESAQYKIASAIGQGAKLSTEPSMRRPRRASMQGFPNSTIALSSPHNLPNINQPPHRQTSSALQFLGSPTGISNDSTVNVFSISDLLQEPAIEASSLISPQALRKKDSSRLGMYGEDENALVLDGRQQSKLGLGTHISCMEPEQQLKGADSVAPREKEYTNEVGIANAYSKRGSMLGSRSRRSSQVSFLNQFPLNVDMGALSEPPCTFVGMEPSSRTASGSGALSTDVLENTSDLPAKNGGNNVTTGEPSCCSPQPLRPREGPCNLVQGRRAGGTRSRRNSQMGYLGVPIDYVV